jgi:hypothetical protein
MRIATIIYHLALSFWVGGAALFTTTLTPTLFRSYSRDMAGGIVGVLIPGYFYWGMACGIIALLCLFLTRAQVRSARVAAILLVIMITLTAAQAFLIVPRAAALKRDIPSFDTSPPDHPLRVQFRKLHGISAAANLAVIAGGIFLVILATPRTRDHNHKIESP